MIGQALGHYRIDAKLGQGGMSVVYRAFDIHLERPVAIKILHPDPAASPERQRRFVQEAKAASSLNHPTSFTSTTSARQGHGFHRHGVRCRQDARTVDRQERRFRIPGAREMHSSLRRKCTPQPIIPIRTRSLAATERTADNADAANVPPRNIRRCSSSLVSCVPVGILTNPRDQEVRVLEEYPKSQFDRPARQR